VKRVPSVKTETVKVDPENPQRDIIYRAADLVRRGGLVVFPTETVYGLGVDWRNNKALGRLHAVKARSKAKSFTAAISNLDQAIQLGCKISGYAYRLMERFWPGPLTLILKTVRSRETLGLRMPDNNIALALLEEADLPVALTSANLSGNPDPLTAEDASRDLDGKVEMILDGGSTKIGVASTVFSLAAQPPRILREGAIKEPELAKIPRKSVLFVCTGNSCRSVMAEGLLKKALQDKSRYDIEVSSAGIAGLSGFSPTEETVDVMREAEVDVSDFKTKTITQDLVNRADLILVMQNIHRREVVRRTPHAKDKVYLLRDYTNDTREPRNDRGEVADPIAQPVEIYREVAGIIKRNIKKLTEML